MPEYPWFGNRLFHYFFYSQIPFLARLKKGNKRFDNSRDNLASNLKYIYMCTMMDQLPPESQDLEALTKELNRFRSEKENIRKLLGRVGGVASRRNENIVTIIFAVAIAVLLISDVLHHYLEFPYIFPPLFSLALGILLVSLKIIWMMHVQNKASHFQFWILNSLEYRLNDIAKNVNKLERLLLDLQQK